MVKIIRKTARVARLSWNTLGWSATHIFFIVLLLIAYYIFQEKIKYVFDNVLVDYILSKFNHPLTLTISILYVALFVAVLFYIFEKIVIKGYKISVLTLSFLVVICILYWQERIFIKNYELFYLNEKAIFGIRLKLLDPFYVTISLITVSLLINYFRNFRYSHNASFFQQDLPIKSIAQDQYNRGSFFTKITEELKKISFDSEKGFAIGINSVWGNGKTSLLAIIKEGLNDKNIIYIDYNPWQSANKHSLTYDFFLMIENELSQYLETSNIIASYGERLSKIDHDQNPLKALGSIFENDKSLKERFDEICLLIRKTNKKFFIVIDDLDRLDNTEVMEVLRLIRNTGNFPRMNFIVTYDKGYVINAISKSLILKPELYIDKIFDLEIVLPKIESLLILEVLMKTFEEGLNKMILKDEELKNIKDQLSSIIFNSNGTSSTKILAIKAEINNFFTSKREIIKFVNSVLLMLNINKDNLYLPDLFVLEMIKLKKFSLYEQLAASDRYLLYNNDSGIRRYRLFLNLDDKQTDELMMNTQRGILYNIRESDDGLIYKKLIEALFELPISEDYNSRHAIGIVDNFEGYFIYTLPSGSFGFNDLDNLIYEND